MVLSTRSLETVVPATSLPQPGQLAPSREVLRRYGNMSSATVLFVLRDLLTRAGHTPERLAALAFGPGLAVEAATLTLRTQA